MPVTLRQPGSTAEAQREPSEACRVPSLASPDPHAALAPADLLDYPAVQLFVERAQAVQPDFVLGPDRVSSVVALCGRLEGLPLALELAAARLSALSLDEIVDRLDRGFQLLVGGSRTAPTRQQTSRATLDWSHGLLSPAEQLVFRRLAVFAGGWTMEAAEAVCTDVAIVGSDVLELLTQLVDKSLVVAGERDGRSRYRLLEPIRQYAWEQLAASGELDMVRPRHATCFLAFAEALGRDANVGGTRRGRAVEALRGEYRNLQVALQWALDAADADVGLRLAWTLQFLWKFRLLPAGEGRLWIEKLLRLPGADAPTPARAVALLTEAWLISVPDRNAADELYAEALALARRLCDPWILSVGLADQGLVGLHRGDFATARTCWEEGLTVTQASGDRATEAMPTILAGVVDTLAGLAAHLGQPEVALRLSAAAEAAWEALGETDLPVDRDQRDRWLIPLRQTLGAEDSGRWWAEGRSLSLKEAIGLVEMALPQIPSSPPPAAGESVGPLTPRHTDGSSGSPGLTSREAEVLRLVAQGQSNKEIAAELVLSVRTVERHITNLYGKIDARGKADATAYAIHHGLAGPA